MYSFLVALHLVEEIVVKIGRIPLQVSLVFLLALPIAAAGRKIIEREAVVVALVTIIITNIAFCIEGNRIRAFVLTRKADGMSGRTRPKRKEETDN